MVIGETSDAPESDPRRRLRIVFFGTPQFAVPSLTLLLQSRHQVCGVVTQPDRPRGRGQKVQDAPVKTRALEHDVPVFQPERLRDPVVEATLRDWAPDLAVVAAYGKLLPEPLLTVPAFGTINVHASLLPKYRGAAPVHRAVINGEAETGVTIMRVVKALDAGDMFAKVRRPIGARRDERRRRARSRQIGSSAARRGGGADRGRHLPRRAAGRHAIQLRAAAHERGRARRLGAPFCRHPQPGQGPLPLAARVHISPGRSVSSCSTTTVLNGGVEEPHDDCLPGTVIEVSREGIHVATGQRGRIAIRQVQAGRRSSDDRAGVLAGHPVPVGARFTGR